MKLVPASASWQERELRVIAAMIAADGTEQSLAAHDELLSGFWHS